MLSKAGSTASHNVGNERAHLRIAAHKRQSLHSFTSNVQENMLRVDNYLSVLLVILCKRKVSFSQLAGSHAFQLSDDSSQRHR